MKPQIISENPNPQTSMFNWCRRPMTTIVSSSLILAEKPSSNLSLNSSIENHYLANDVLTTFPDQPILNGLDRLLFSLGITDVGLGSATKEVLDLFVRSKEESLKTNDSSSESTEFQSLGEILDKHCSEFEREKIISSRNQSFSRDNKISIENLKDNSNTGNYRTRQFEIRI